MHYSLQFSYSSHGNDVKITMWQSRTLYMIIISFLPFWLLCLITQWSSVPKQRRIDSKSIVQGELSFPDHDLLSQNNSPPPPKKNKQIWWQNLNIIKIKQEKVLAQWCTSYNKVFCWSTLRDSSVQFHMGSTHVYYISDGLTPWKNK